MTVRKASPPFGVDNSKATPALVLQTHHLPVLLLLAMSSSGQSSLIEAREHDGTAAAAEGLEFEGVAGKALLGGEPVAAGAPANTGGI